MSLNHSSIISLLFAFIVVCSDTCGVITSAQAQDSHAPAIELRVSGIELYNQGDTKGAITALRRAVKQNRYDADAWYYLGAALSRNENMKDARKAFMTAIELRPEHVPSHVGLANVLLNENKLEDASREVGRALELDAGNVEAHYVLGRIHLRNQNPELALRETETATKLDAKYAPAYLLRCQAILSIYIKESFLGDAKNGNAEPLSLEELKALDVARRKRFKDAAESLESYVILSANTSAVNVWREQLESLKLYSESQEKDGIKPGVRAGFEVDTKARILSKPSPDYPRMELGGGITGTATVFLTLSFDGTIKNVLVIHAPSNRFADSAIQAARKIKFVPAVKDGKPVSQILKVEYNFNIF